MVLLIGRLIRAAYRRRGMVVAAVLAALVVSAEGARRLTFDADVLSLLPRDGRVIPAFRQFLASFGSMDQLYVVLTAPEGYAATDYAETIDAWINHLRDAPEIARLDAGVADRTRDFGWLADRQLLLFHDASLGIALDRLRPEGLRDAIASRRELLTMPSPDIVELVRQDPAGLTDLVAQAIGGADAGFSMRTASQGYLSEDGRSRLLIAQPRRPPYDADFSRALDSRLRQIAQAVQETTRRDSEERSAETLPPLQVQFAGGHRIALETEALVRRESILNMAGSLALILPLLYFVFRSVWLVVVGSIPSALSLLVVLGALGFAGSTLSAAATGSAAMLFGLGVDGVVLLYVAFRLSAAQGATPESAVAATAGPSSSMLLGMWTTAATFYGLTFVDFPSLQQLGLLIGHSMLACGVLTLVLVPALLPHRAPRRPIPALVLPALARWIASRRRTILIIAALATVLLALAATRMRINPTLDRLKSVTDAALLEQRIAPMFGLPREVYVVTADGPDLEALLESNERLVHRVEAALPDVRIHAPTLLLPSNASQEHRATEIRRSGLAPASVRAALDEAGDAEGFKRGSFAPFAERLPRLLNATERLTYEGYATHGLSDLLARFVVRDAGQWRIATYAYPTTPAQLDTLQQIVDATDRQMTLTGLPLVNRELADRFVPQFLKGLAIGTVIVVVLVVLAFRNWRLSVYSLLPTAVGLVWAAGLLAMAGVELDLFALFAVVTFVGIGVDYGIHLVHRFQERGDAERAVGELAPVILTAAAITMLGYGTLLGSSYPPLRSIGLVSAVSVVTLAVSSVLVLPALLMGRGK